MSGDFERAAELVEQILDEGLLKHNHVSLARRPHVARLSLMRTDRPYRHPHRGAPMLTIFTTALAVLFGIGFFAVLVGASQQADDLQRRIDHRDARIEDLENELRWQQRGRHPAGRGLLFPVAVSDTPCFDEIATERHLAEVRSLPTRGGEGA